MNPLSRVFAVTLAVALFLVARTAGSGDTDPVGPIANPPILHPPPIVSPLPPYPENSILEATAPVRLPGGGGVSDSGQATYSIPLQVPAGPGSLEPHLSIVYGGGSGNGHLGVGMALGGLSAIRPCNQTFASEGFADGVEFDGSDSYCLDGQKLVFIKYAYGNNNTMGSEYRTEVDSFQRIVATYVGTTCDDFQDSGDCQLEFKVWRRDGMIAIYKPRAAFHVTGVDGDTEPKADELKVYPVYPIDSLVDRTGLNRLKYEYDDNPDSFLPKSRAHEFSYRISKISYSFSGTTPRRWIQFSYEGRPDHTTMNASGVLSAIRSRLVRIETFAPNPEETEPVWRYLLDYTLSPDTQRSLLHTLQLCAGVSSCSWIRSFEWTTPQALGTIYESYKDTTITPDVEFDDEALSRDFSSLLEYTAGGNFFDPTDTQLLLFDADGDGSDDALYRTRRTRILSQRNQEYEISINWNDYERGQIMFRRSAEAPLSEPHDVTSLFEPDMWNSPPEIWGGVDGDVDPPGGRFPPLGQAWVAHLGKSRVADLDEDGVSNLLLARTRLEEDNFWQPPGDGMSNTNKWWFGYTDFGKWHWDTGKSDKLDEDKISIENAPVYRDSSNSLNQTRHLFTPPFQRALADLDGDGIVEAIDAFEKVDLSLDLTALYEDWDNYFSSDHARPYVTVLADGVTKRVFGRWTCGNGNLRVADVDGNGRDDLLAINDQRTSDVGGLLYDRLYLDGPALLEGSKTNISDLWAGNCAGLDPDLVMADFNGDGLEDALYPPRSLDNNLEPLIRWNLGNGFGKAVKMEVKGQAGLNDLLYAPVPVGRDGRPVPWDRGTRAVDANQDGRTDIVAFRLETVGPCLKPEVNGGCDEYNTIVALYLSAGDHFEAQVIKKWDKGGISLAHGFTTAQVGDVTGDGSSDLVHVVDGRIHVLQLPWREQPDLLAGVSDEGAAHPLETFEYSRQWWGDHQRPGPDASCVYPISCTRRGFSVVQQHAEFLGTRENGPSLGAGPPMYRQTRHTFGGPVADLKGRGFLGFTQHRIWDIGLGQDTIVQFDPAAIVDPTTDPGGVFHPGASVPATILTITPIRPLPSHAEVVGGTGITPGLSGFDPVDVRVTEKQAKYTYDGSICGRVLRVQSKHDYMHEWEAKAQLNSSDTPFFSNLSDTMGMVSSEVIVQYDEYGNVIKEESLTDGGNHWTASYSYEDGSWAVDNWLVSLRKKSATTSYATGAFPPGVDTPEQVTRIVRTTFYPETGHIESVRSSGRDHDCLAPVGNEEACELAGVNTTFTRNARGLVTQTVSTAPGARLPRKTTYTYDKEGVHLARVTDAAGFATTVLRHPAYGVPVLAIDAVGVKTSMTYDAFGRSLTVSRPGTPKLERTYTIYSEGLRRGIKASDVSSDGSQASATSDELGRSIRQAVLGSDGNWLVSRREYNDFGLLERASRPDFGAPAAAGSAWTYDRLGRMLSFENAEGKTTTYAQRRFSTKAVDPEGHASYVERDLDGRIKKSGHYIGDEEDSEDEEYGEVLFIYGAFDQVIGITDANGNVTGMAYDELGRRTLLSDPDAGETQTSYNGFGEPTSETTADEAVTTRAYDTLGRLIHTKGPDGDTTLTWDDGPHAAGRLVASVGPDVATTYDYDLLGRPERIARTIDGATYEIRRAYDWLGRLKILAYPKVAGRARFKIRYDYDANGYLHAIHDASSCYILDEPDNINPPCLHPRELWHVVSRSNELAEEDTLLGGVIPVDRAYNFEMGWVDSISAPTANYFLSYDHYDDGNVRSRVDGATGRTEKFYYDALHRLTDWEILLPAQPHHGGEQGPMLQGPHRTYSYDEIGNLNHEQTDDEYTFAATFGLFGGQEKPHAMGWSSHDFEQGGASFTYDERGRQLTGEGRTIAYSQYDLPRTIKTAADLTTFQFDETGGRVRKMRTGRHGSKSTIYVGGLYERRDDFHGEHHVFYVSGESGVVAQVMYEGPKTVTRYIVGDGIGSATLILHEDGTAAERTLYDPFGGRIDEMGNPVSGSGVDPATTVGFTGHEHDEGSLINMRGRIYDRAQFRFLTPDPFVPSPLFGQSHNPYSYVLNNPLLYTDPTGFQPVPPQPISDTTGQPIQPGPDGTIEVIVRGEPRNKKTDSDAGSNRDVFELRNTQRDASFAAGFGTVGRLVGTSSTIRSVIWQGPAAKRFVSPIGFWSSPAGQFGLRSLEATWYFRTESALISGPLLKLTGNAQWMRSLLYYGIWAPMSGIYAFHAGASGHQMVRLISTEQLNVAAKGGVGSIGMFIETPAYRWGQAAIPAFRALGTGLTIGGGAIDAVDMIDNIGRGNYVDATINSAGVAGAAVSIFGSPTNPVGLGLSTFRASYGLTYWALESLDHGSHLEPDSGEYQPSAPNPGGSGAGPTSVWGESGAGGAPAN